MAGRAIKCYSCRQERTWFRVHGVDFSHNKECPICQEDPKEKAIVVLDVCGHTLCSTCCDRIAAVEAAAGSTEVDEDLVDFPIILPCTSIPTGWVFRGRSENPWAFCSTCAHQGVFLIENPATGVVRTTCLEPQPPVQPPMQSNIPPPPPLPACYNRIGRTQSLYSVPYSLGLLCTVCNGRARSFVVNTVGDLENTCVPARTPPQGPLRSFTVSV